MTIEQYHADTTHATKSALDLIHKSPWHYYRAKIQPLSNVAKEQTPALAFGSAYHDFVLQPDLFFAKYAIIPQKLRGAAKTEFMEECEFNERTPITMSDFKTVEVMRTTLMESQFVRDIFAKGVAEKTLKWTDPLTGVACKCRPDWMPENEFLVDLKSTANASKREFERSVKKYRYHVQDPFYCDGSERRSMIFIAQEKTPPFAFGVYMLSPDDQNVGRLEYQADLETLARCRENNQWPMYNDGELTMMDLPGW